MRNKRFLKLLDQFDVAAMDWGWEIDQGYVKETIKCSQEWHDETKFQLMEFYAGRILKRRVRRAVSNLVLEHFKRVSYQLGASDALSYQNDFL